MSSNRSFEFKTQPGMGIPLTAWFLMLAPVPFIIFTVLYHIGFQVFRVESQKRFSKNRTVTPINIPAMLGSMVPMLTIRLLALVVLGGNFGYLQALAVEVLAFAARYAVRYFWPRLFIAS